MTWPYILEYLIDFKSAPHDWRVMVFELLRDYLCIALVEEIAFRGFIQTRMLGLIRNKYGAIAVVGVMFALMHIPYQMLHAGMSFIDFVMSEYPYLIIKIFKHVFFLYLYTRNQELIAPTTAHALSNFIVQ